MKSEKLLRAIGEIDDRFIEEADVQAAVNNGVRRRRRSFAAIAASLAVIVMACVLAVNGDPKMAGSANNTMSYAETASNTSADANTAAPGNVSQADTNAPGSLISDAERNGYSANTAEPPATDDACIPDEDGSKASAPGPLVPLDLPHKHSYAMEPGSAVMPAMDRYASRLGFPGLIWQKILEDSRTGQIW